MTSSATGEPASPRAVFAQYPPHDDTLPSLLASRAAACPTREAVRFEARSWTYRQLEQASVCVARWLLAQGVGEGECVAYVGPNSDTALLVFLGAARIGAVFVPLNAGLTDADLSHQLGHCRARLVFTPLAQVPRLEAVLAVSGRTCTTVALDQLGHTAGTAAAALEFLQLSLTQADDPLPEVSAQMPLVVIYTSGTTGRPKGVVHSHRSFVWAAEVFVGRLWLQPGERLMTVFPLFHINALGYSFGGALACGGTFITVPRFSASSFWDSAVDTGATQLNILAALGNILGRRPRAEFRPAHRIRKVYGGPISEAMFRLFQEEFGIPTLIEGYGMSEIPATCSNPFDGVHKLGSIGLPDRHPRIDEARVQVRIVDEHGVPVATGTTGELMVKSPFAFLHYLDAEAQTAAAFRDSWFATGDLVRADADGYVYFVARGKDIIRRRGENIAGAEIDEVLGRHPDIVAAAAVAVPSALGDDEILAVVVRREGSGLGVGAVHAWCTRHLARIKVPRFITFADALPMTPSHRVEKHRLAADATLVARAVDMDGGPLAREA